MEVVTRENDQISKAYGEHTVLNGAKVMQRMSIT
jgi:hypothetical protein